MGFIKRTAYLGFVVGTGGIGAAAKWAAVGTEGARQRKRMAEANERTAAAMERLTRANASANASLSADVQGQIRPGSAQWNEQFVQRRIQWLDDKVTTHWSVLNRQEQATVEAARQHPEAEDLYEEARKILSQRRRRR